MRRALIKVAFGVIIFLTVALVVSMQLLRDIPGEMMEDAKNQRNAGYYSLAAEKFGQIATVYPDSAHADEALYQMGFTYYVVAFPKVPVEEKGVMLRLAQHAFERAVADYPGSEYVADSRLYLGEIYTIMREDAKAIENYEAAAMLIDDRVRLQEIYHKMANNYERLGRIDKANEHQQRIIDLGIPGRFYEKAFLRKVGYYRLGAEENEDNAATYHEQIVALMRQLLSSDKEISFTTRQEALLVMSYSLMELKEFDQAEEALNKIEKTSIHRDRIESLLDRLERQRNLGK